MIPCAICGKDASLGVVQGFVPAPDSQKLALCTEHDTAKNRARLLADWQSLLQNSIKTAAEVDAYHVARGRLMLLTIQFSGGGSMALPCLHAEPTPQGTLKVNAEDDSLHFFPLAQIRRYTLSPQKPTPLDPS